MAVAHLGRYFLLTVLIVFIHVGYGFKIRDHNSEQQCAVGSKCQSHQTLANVIRKTRDNDGLSVTHETGKLEVNKLTLKIDSDDKGLVKRKSSWKKLKSDDDDDGVVIEDADIEESDTIGDDDDGDAEKDDTDDESDVISKTEEKEEDVTRESDETDELGKETSIFKRNVVSRRRDAVREKMKRNEERDGAEGDDEDAERETDDDDDNDDDDDDHEDEDEDEKKRKEDVSDEVKIENSDEDGTEEEKEKEEAEEEEEEDEDEIKTKETVKKVMRQFTKVRLADKDKVKLSPVIKEEEIEGRKEETGVKEEKKEVRKDRKEEEKKEKEERKEKKEVKKEKKEVVKDEKGERTNEVEEKKEEKKVRKKDVEVKESKRVDKEKDDLKFAEKEKERKEKTAEMKITTEKLKKEGEEDTAKVPNAKRKVKETEGIKEAEKKTERKDTKIEKKEKVGKTETVKVKDKLPEQKKEVKKKKDRVKDQPNRNSVGKQPDGKKTSEKKVKKPDGAKPTSLVELNEKLLLIPNFLPNFTAVENPKCQQQGKIFLRQLRGFKLWALQMLDATAKMPSGLLRGNVNQLGDFDECLNVLSYVKLDKKTVRIQGKYCLANIDLQASLANMRIPVNLMQSRAFIRGNKRDPGHFIPKFTTINWGLCIPDGCSASDAKTAVENALNHLNETTGIRFLIDVDPDLCYVRQKTSSYSKETIAVLYFYLLIVCLVLVATVRDFFTSSTEKGSYSERMIMAFSLRKTSKTLMKAANPDEISCIHGIRTLATIGLYVAHKTIPAAGIPFTNRIVFTEIANNPLSILLRGSLMYTDCFLLLSGVLSAFNMSHELKSRGEIRWFCRFFARFIRLTPLLLLVIFWYAFVMEHVGSGPQWNSIIKTNANLCKENAWTNLLYIQNFFPFEKMCATHTHQLALDMQLSLIVPIVVFFLQLKPIAGVLVIFFLLQVSATLRYFATMNNYLSLVIYHGATAKQLYKTANLTYILPLHRMTPYLFGVGLGVLLDYTGKSIKIYKALSIMGWIFAGGLSAWAFFSPWKMARRDYTYNLEDAAQYAVINPVFWALALCWIIFACHTNYGGIINRVLSNYWLLLFSRISYSFYLIQFTVFFYNLASTRYSSEFHVNKILDPYEFSTVLIISTILTLFFDIPMQEIKGIVMEFTDIKLESKSVSRSNKEEKNLPEKPPNTENIDPNSQWEWKEDADEENDDEGDEREWIRLRQNGRRKSQSNEQFESWVKNEKLEMDEKRRSRSAQRFYDYGGEAYHEPPRRLEEQFRRERRSLSRQRHHDEAHVAKRDPSPVAGYLPFNISSLTDPHESRYEQPRLPQRAPVRLLSSESEDEFVQRRRNPRSPVERPRVSDEDDWEHELRIRRKRFMEKSLSDDQDIQRSEESENPVSRRSSAEGKIALLTGSTGPRVMDAWTISRGRRVSHLGSSQEPSETEDEFQGEYRDVDQKKLMNPPLVIHHEAEGEPEVEPISDAIPVPTGKLFKRESIIKSQASEEDPEYLLPERPKLVEQEQEHPFKKAWQMQKSRSEEDGPSAFAIKDGKVTTSESGKDKKSLSPNRTDDQPFQLIVEDTDDAGDTVNATLVMPRRDSVPKANGNRDDSRKDSEEEDPALQ